MANNTLAGSIGNVMVYQNSSNDIKKGIETQHLSEGKGAVVSVKKIEVESRG